MNRQLVSVTDAVPYQEFAKLIGKTPRAVRGMIEKGKLPVIEITDPQSVSGRAGEYWVDEQDWTITKVTHFLNNSGFTTSLELEVRLSDVEYETEDDE